MPTGILKTRGYMSSQIVVLSICIVFILFADSVFANDTFVYDNGHTVYPIETDDVRMISEKVSITMHGDSATVKCSFIFENIREKTINAKLGFPVTPNDYIYMEEDQDNVKPPLRNFRSYVEGITAEVNVRLDKSQKKWMYWYTWDVTFPSKKHMTLQNEYEVQLSMSYYHRWLEYILITGANWKGPIESAVIEVVYKNNEELRNGVMYICPEGYRVDDNRIVWEFRNFTPKNNVLVYERGHDPLYTIHKVLIDILNAKNYDGHGRQYNERDIYMQATKLSEATTGYESYFHFVSDPSDPCLKKEFINHVKYQFVRLIRNEIFARHGRIFESKDLKRIFKATDWYKPDPNYSDDMLNDIEKKNIQFILDYEKKMGWR